MKRVLLIASACLAVAGCGFHPLYDQKLQPQLASIYVEPLDGRDGYTLRNTLIDLLGAGWARGGGRSTT